MPPMSKPKSTIEFSAKVCQNLTVGLDINTEALHL